MALPSVTSKTSDRLARYSDMFSAMGNEPRLRIMRLLLTACPEGLVVSEIQEEIQIPNSTLSHHLEKLRAEDLVEVKREGTFLRYSANTSAYRNCCSFSMPSAVPVTKRLNRRTSCRFPDRSHHEQDSRKRASGAET